MKKFIHVGLLVFAVLIALVTIFFALAGMVTDTIGISEALILVILGGAISTVMFAIRARLNKS